MSQARKRNKNVVKAAAAGLLLLALLAFAAIQGRAVAAASPYSLWPLAAQLTVSEAPTAPTVRVVAAADVRSGPGPQYLMLAYALPGEEFAVLGQSADRLWYRIDFGGQRAWLPSAAAATTAQALRPAG